jgi:Domain of unknown function (DUF4191)
MAKSATTEKKQGTLSKLLAAYKITRRRDRYIGVICLAAFLVVGGILGGLFWVFLHPIAGVIVGASSGLLAAMLIFGRRAERAAYAEFEGKPGAAAAALGVLRRGWQVQPAVAVTKSQDLVHRVVGRPGVVLIGEGNPSRVRHLLAIEKKKHARVVGETPIHDIVVGDGPDAIPVHKLTKYVMKLPRKIQPADVTDLLQRLKALDAMRPQLPIPKGPMPTSTKQARSSMRGGR